MSSAQRKDLRASLQPYAQRCGARAIALLALDLSIYVAASAGAVVFASTWAKIACVLVAGTAISALFVIGHDAAHGSFTPGKRLDRILGRLAFAPSLHNFSLWQVVHNRQHHRWPNLKGLNSWSPLSKADYDALSLPARCLQRFYRSALGLGTYYLVERWWKCKFFPRRRVVGRHRAAYWWDFALLLVYLAAWLGALALLAERLGHEAPWAAWLWGFVLPFAVWNSETGFTTYLQHTHPRVPWFDDVRDWQRLGGQEKVTVHVRFPRWFGLVSHDIMEHPAHHANPKVPLYHLREAQHDLADTLGERLVAESFSLSRFVDTVSRCKLYDFRGHRWLDFAGRPTSDRTLTPSGEIAATGRPLLA